MSLTPAPIETRYKGYRFRSRLEARWAVFFDALGLKWEYEPEGFQTSAGWYLPDFRITKGAEQFYLEVKPAHVPVDDPRLEAFAKVAARGIRWTHGDPMDDIFPRDRLTLGFLDDALLPEGVDRNAAALCLRAYHDRALVAAESARAARFEHGETPR